MATTDLLPVTTMLNMVAAIKLNATNFLPWRRQIMHMAECFDLMGLLDGTAVAPPPTITSTEGATSINPAYTTWKIKDKMLLSVMYSSLSEDAASEVIDSSTSRDTWLTLEGVFSSASRQYQLREELLSLRWGDSSVEEYGKKFKLLCDQLSAIGRPVEETDKSHWFLRGLGIQFTGFADTRMALSPIPIFRDLLNQAKRYDGMLRTMEGSTSQVVFTATRDPSSYHNSSHGRGQSSGNLRHSAETGGRGRGQYSNSRDTFFGNHNGGKGSNNGAHKPYIPRCQICRGEHYADKCPKFLSACQATSSAHLAQEFTSSCNISDPTPDWYLDSGASAHMTNQPAALDSFEPYSGSGSVIVASGDKENSGSGKVR